MAEPKLYLHYAGEKFFVDRQSLSRLYQAVTDAGSGTEWLNLYGRGGAGGDQDVTILVGAGIPMVIKPGDE